MNIFVINSLFFGFSMFLMSILVLLKRWDDLGRRWFYFSIFVTAWAIPNAFLIDNRSSYDLALTVSSGIVEKHRGKISVISEDGRGTAFTVQFPQAKEKIVPARR